MTPFTIERLHLKLLKWTLHVHAKVSNLACWGDSGRWPLVVHLLKQAFDYSKRLEFFHHTNTDTLVRHTYAEQKELNLPWFTNTNGLLNGINENGGISSSVIRDKVKTQFENVWLQGIGKSSKLQFYASIKKQWVANRTWR